MMWTKSVSYTHLFYDFVDDWNHKFYFLVGGYGSSKSYHVAVKLIKKLLEEKRKALVVREVFDTIRDSCYDLLAEVADAMEVSDYMTSVSYTHLDVYKRQVL